MTRPGPDLGNGPSVAYMAEAARYYSSGAAEVRALEGVDVSFGAGEFTAIMGPPRSGKSTLMHCMAGLGAWKSSTPSPPNERGPGAKAEQVFRQWEVRGHAGNALCHERQRNQPADSTRDLNPPAHPGLPFLDSSMGVG